MLESYDRAYNNMVRVQQLSELEEVRNRTVYMIFERVKIDHMIYAWMFEKLLLSYKTLCS